uniref:SFRICE_038348 n=1 Tax=Spodoptera frugiperda TaxID=7108 RepID=A0A2H1WSB1_SPOFR
MGIVMLSLTFPKPTATEESPMRAPFFTLGVTSDPNWRANSTLARQDSIESGQGEQRSIPDQLQPNSTRNVSEQFVDVITFMMQEPLCMWSGKRPYETAGIKQSVPPMDPN